MNAAIVHALGQPPRYGEFAAASPGPGEVRVRVQAAGVHQLVRAIVAGTHYASTGEVPFVPGVDGVGTLDDGTPVYFGLPAFPRGTMAETCVVPRQMCFPLPAGLSAPRVAASMNPALSSWLALGWRGSLVPGETVLVLGATGVSGQLAVQLAKRLGAGRVIAAGRNPEVLEALRSRGADAVVRIDEPESDFRAALARATGGEGVDLVVDYVWGMPAERLMAALTERHAGHSALVRKPTARQIRWVQVGEMAGRTISLRAALLRANDLVISGCGGGSVPAARLAEAIPEVIRCLNEAAIWAEVETVSLAEVETAWRRESPGKRLVLVP